jgi:hypothetical protein
MLCDLLMKRNLLKIASFMFEASLSNVLSGGLQDLVCFHA